MITGCSLVEKQFEEIPLNDPDNMTVDLSACVDDPDVCFKLFADNKHLFPIYGEDGHRLTKEEVTWPVFLKWAKEQVAQPQ
jgi:hypothetical protein